MASAEELAAWDALPIEEHHSVWDETERNFWANQERQNAALDKDAEQSYHKTVTDAKVELSNLTGRRSQLAESQVRLSRELAKVEEELARVSQACDEGAERLNRTEQEYRDGQQARLESRQKVRKTMRRFFKEKRGEDPDAEDPEDIRLERPAPVEEEPALPPHTNGTAPSERDVQPDTPVVEDTRMNDVGDQNEVPQPQRSQPYDKTGLDVMVDVVDADGNVIGPVERIEPWNQWVEAIQDIEIRRPVKIRRGRRFNEAHLSTIYERTEAKGVKWLSCMIQATGEIQTKRCQSCDKNQGAFDDCIIVGGDLFQKCGNCEWNRQGCHGASGDVIDVPMAKRRPIISPLRHPLPAPHYGHPPPHHHAALAPLPLLAPQPIQPDKAQPSTEVDMPAKDGPLFNGNGSQIVREPEQMPTPQEYRGTPGFTPANARSRPPSADRPTPTSMHIEPSPQPTESPSEEPLEEITKDNLVLRDNGVVYTFPECVQGVPLVKIDENHPYWEPNWPNVRKLIEPQLAKWREKHQTAIEAGPKQEKGGSSKYQIGRQVNRGLKILEFLEDGEISPYQLLGKKFIQSGKGGICSYDTLFRLSETMSELAKFKLDIKAIDWMRHRLYELSIAEGPSFNLPRTIHDFYHDPKLTALRYKHGFKNIGRPSGMKTSRHSLGSPNSTPKPLKKRKSMHSLASTPRDMSYVDHSPLATQMALPPDSAFGAHLQKRPKILSPAPMPVHDEFEVANYSDADSWSGERIGRRDYRLYQVKSRLYTSSTHVTQYWSWMEDDQSFEHQVLKSVRPATWGVHKDPIDFHVTLADVAQVVWNIEALRIHIFMRTDGSVLAKKDGQLRGDLMAAFKREQTMRRFLKFCRDKGVRMLKATT
ncbi:hypothetical protein EDB81DRAFT_843868 [Dactylonectria macrodidyma]|uniref:Uncharacterized protein n=1 Tax=Dactylonectria macrodidyma TaxID=307937 RepID=A0A9P9EPM3_9HYPO|nr:hypothetical protein EDB81DRAFT_843868 [Dactylonectria macrodidyma]